MTDAADDIQSAPARQDVADLAIPGGSLAALLAMVDIPGEIHLPDGAMFSVGTGEPVYTLRFRSERALRTPLTELGVGRAYVSGDLDITGDLDALFGLRHALRENVPLRQKIRFLYDLARTATAMNAKAIGQHYSRGDDFYLTFIDKRFRFYSQGLFRSPDETIEEASEHKLETMVDGLGLKPGMRLLDIGGGWGGVTQYCGARGVHVTTLTIAEDSARYIQCLVDENDLPGEVFLQDFLDHRPAEPYDHAVIFGVIEHLPHYRRFAAQVWRVLKPGGRLYLDASAAVQKFSVSAFTRDYIWQGAHTFMTLQHVIAELLYHGFEIVDVTRETRDYKLTMLEWAKRLDAAEHDITTRWGEETYRAFRLFLWGGAHAFRTNALQAYHLIAERTATPGPRPSDRAVPRQPSLAAFTCDALSVPLVWVTGNSGVGKSTVCALLKSRGELAVDADWEGYNHWVDRTSGQVVVDPPYPAPAGWLDRFGWKIRRAEVEALAARAHDKTAFLCGSAENEADVWDLFDLVVCVVVDNDTLRDRLLTRTTNAFGKHPEELAAAMECNDSVEPTYRRLGATIIDGRRPLAEVADAVLAAADCMSSSGA